MSAAHDAHPDAGHGDDHAHAFDGEPVQELSADEPRTPGWVPAVGLMFLLAVVVAVLATRDAVPGSEEEGKAAATQTAAATAAAAPPVERPQPPQRPSVVPPPSGSGPLQKLTPEQARDLQKRMEEFQKRRAAGTAVPGMPPPPTGN